MTPRNTNGRSRTRVRRIAAAVAVAGLLDSPAAWAQAPTPDVIATYGGLDPKGSFTFKMKGATHTKPVGLLNWDVPQDQFSTAGLDRSFKAFCAEPLVGVTAGNTYSFNLLSPDSTAAYNLPDTEAGRKEANLRGVYIRELFGRSYLSSQNPATPDAARAFQAALWELAYETELPATFEPGQAKFDLFTGTFQAEYPNRADAPAFVTTAQTYLTDLTGNDSVFSSTPGLAGLELVRLNGLPNAASVVAQDQYALRSVSAGAGGNASSAGGGGVGGGGFGSPIGGGGGGFGGPVGGGGFGGGGGGLLGGIGGGSTTSPPGTTVPPSTLVNVPPLASPPVSPPITTPRVPPINNVPPSPPGTDKPKENVPPVVPPVVPPLNPVPGPSGLILGGIAAMVFAGRRAVTRLTAAK